MNISLIGLQGAGKTSVSRLLAKKLDRKLISINEEVAKKTSLSAEKLMKMYGSEKFHDIQSEIIENVSDFDDCIIDTPSGIITRNENIMNLKKNGLVILLTADARTITNRIKNNRELSSLIKKAYLGEVREIFQEREDKYKKSADYAIDTSGLLPEEICDLIIHYVQMELQ